MTTDNAIRLSHVSDEGYKDYNMGVSFFDNPYNSDTEEYDAWYTGWYTARFQRRRVLLAATGRRYFA